MKTLMFSITKKNLELTWFSGTGAGGQYRNKHQNCARLKHPESGATATGQSNRDRVANKKEAIDNLLKNPRFKIWLARKMQELTDGQTLDQKVDASMAPRNIWVEYRDDSGKWTPFTSDEEAEDRGGEGENN